MSDSIVRTEALRIRRHRSSPGSCADLGASIRDEGLRRPVVVWKDGTLISGERRAFAALIMEIPTLRAVFVNTVEDAAKHLLGDNQDNYLAVEPKWSEVCSLWQTLRRLDEPAAARRADANRRRGVELRRATQRGDRRAGRSHGRSDDYVLRVICEPYDVSAATAKRVETIYRAATGLDEVTADKQELARSIMADLDAGSPVWPGYERFRGGRPPLVSRPRPVAPVDPAPAAKQITAWDKTLPTLEGTIAGLVSLGPPNAELTWDQVGPVRIRLAAARRELEKIINQMKPKENTKP